MAQFLPRDTNYFWNVAIDVSFSTPLSSPKIHLQSSECETYHHNQTVPSLRIDALAVLPMRGFFISTVREFSYIVQDGDRAQEQHRSERDCMTRLSTCTLPKYLAQSLYRIKASDRNTGLDAFVSFESESGWLTEQECA